MDGTDVESLANSTHENIGKISLIEIFRICHALVKDRCAILEYHSLLIACILIVHRGHSPGLGVQ